MWNDPYPEWSGKWARDTDQLRVGTYIVWRRSHEGSTQPSELGDPAAGACGVFEGKGVPCIDQGSQIYVADFWAKLRYGPLYGETEFLKIGGQTFGGVPFPAKNKMRKADMTSGALRLGYFGTDRANHDLFRAILEVGHASGDDVLEDERFSQRPIHPDYNVGLILYEEILRELSARTYGPPFFSDENPEGATGLFSKGGVMNSNYINPRFHYQIPFGGFKLVGGVLFAWVDTLASTGTAMFFSDATDSSYLGTEFDLALKSDFAGHMNLSVETGYLRFGGALKSVYDKADGSFTLQSRLAFSW